MMVKHQNSHLELVNRVPMLGSEAIGSPSTMLTFLRFAAPIASQFVFLAPLSTMRKIVSEKSCGKVSPLPFSSMVIAGAIWSTYGFLKQEASIWAPNLSAILLGSLYVSIYSRYAEGQDKKTIQKHGVGGAMLLGLLGFMTMFLPRPSALQCIGLLGTAIVVVMFSGPLATIKTVIRDRSTNSLPPLFTLASLCNCILWTSLGFAMSDAFIWAPNVLGLAAALIQVGLFAVYGLPGRVSRSEEEVGMVDRSLTA